MSTSRQDFLIASLRDAESKKALLKAELKKAEDTVKNLKKFISTIDKEVTGIYDELVGRVSFPILDAIEEAQQQPIEVAQPIQPETLPITPLAIIEPVNPSQLITFERVGKRGDSFDCVHFYRNNEVFQVQFDKIEIRLIGDDPSSYKNYLDLCDTAWNELHQEDIDQEVLARLIEDIQPLSSDWIAWKIEENIITLLKGLERRVVPKGIIATYDLLFNMPSEEKSLEALWRNSPANPEEAKESIQEEEVEPTPQAAPEAQHDKPKEVKEKYVASVQPGGVLSIALGSQSRGFGSVGKKLLEHYGYSLYDKEGEPTVNKIPQKILGEMWKHHINNFEEFNRQRFECRITSPDCTVAQIEMIYKGQTKVFGNQAMLDHLTKKHLCSLMEIPQRSLSELWHNPERLMAEIEDDGIEKIHPIFLADKSLVLKLGGRTRKVSAASVPENFNSFSQDELNELWVSDKARDYYPKDGELPNVPATESNAVTVVAATPTKTSKRKSKNKSTEVTT